MPVSFATFEYKAMNRAYKITYSILHNARLKEVNFHGKLMLPLYIRIVHNRESTLLKSYYFDLYQKPLYNIKSLAGNKPPSLEKIIERENELVTFILKKISTHFSLDLFKIEYYYYSRNILSLMEGDFLNYLTTFLQDEGLPVLSTLINNNLTYSIESLMDDLKSGLKQTLYTKLMENAVFYAPPYIPLMAYIKSLKTELPLFLPVFIWDNDEVKKNFKNFLSLKYSQYSENTVFKFIDNIVK